MKKRLIIIPLLFAMGAFFSHQYRWAGPYDAYLRQETIPSEEVFKNLKRWRYHTDVWFEIVPDALTTVFKRLGLGGWTETGHRACVEGCVYWTQKWTDGFHSADLELEKISLRDGKETILEEPRFIDVESWGKIREALESTHQLPQTGHRVRICGPLRLDRPYDVFTLHPDRPEDYLALGVCETLPKEPSLAIQLVAESDCQNLSKRSLFDQIAVLDSLASAKKEERLGGLIEKTVQCVDPKVLQSLSTHADVYEALVKRAPNMKADLPPLVTKKNREGNPVKNTIADLLRHWFNLGEKS